MTASRRLQLSAESSGTIGIAVRRWGSGSTSPLPALAAAGVSAEIELRDERVEIDRRAVDRPLGEAEDAFRDQVIEAEERREEPVISMEARVVEEIDLRRREDVRRETVRDTVRSTEVEVEDDRVEAGSDIQPNRR